MVEEPFPELTDAERDQFLQLPVEQREALADLRDRDAYEALQLVYAQIQPDTEVQEDAPEGEVIQQGEFSQIDAARNAEGTATLYETADGERVLHLADFISTKGPGLHVYLTQAGDTLGENFVDLGELEANAGSQNYVIPEEINLDEYNGVIIYDDTLEMIFSAATF